MKRLAIIPIRAGSKRLKQKNYRIFDGKPLFHHTVEVAQACGLFDTIHISTESQEIYQLCEEIGAAPDFFRPEEFATDTATLTSVCQFVLEEYQRRGQAYEEFCMLWATSPMRTAQDIIDSYQMLDAQVDGVISVTDFDLPVFCAQKIDETHQLTPVFPDMLRLPGSAMPKVVCDNGSICWVKVDAFWKHGTWLMPTMKGYHMPRSLSVDLDTQEDWDLMEYYYNKQKELSKNV